MRKEFNFAEAFGNLDEDLVAGAASEWKQDKRYIFQLYSRKITGVAAVLLLALVLSQNSSVQAAVKQLGSKIGEFMGYSKDLSSYTEIIGETKSDNGYSLTLNEVILDKYVFMASVKESEEDSYDGGLVINWEKTTINGKSFLSASSITSINSGTDNADDYTEKILSNYYDEPILSKDTAEIHLVIDRDKFSEAKAGEEVDTITLAEFTYDFTISSDELQKQTIVKKLDNKISGELSDDLGFDIVLKEIRLNDLYCRIETETTEKTAGLYDDYELILEGKDSKGNTVRLTPISSGNEKNLVFTVNEFSKNDSAVISEENNEECEMPLPDKDSKYIDLQLYVRKIVLKELDSKYVVDDLYEQEYIVDTEYYDSQENNGWVAVGDAFRINLSDNEDSQIIGGADEKTSILIK